MRKVVVGLLGISLASGLGLSLSPAAVAAPPADSPASVPSVKNGSEASSDELVSPLEQKRRTLREKAVSDVVSGRAKLETRNGSTVVKVGQAAGGGAFGGQARSRRGAKDNRDQYVELAREKTDRIFVILAEFGNERDPRFPDQDTDPTTPGPQRFDGPVHNQIPEPDRAVDNSTIWQPDYNREHYQQVYFGQGKNVESVKTYYETQSSGRYSVDGTVTDWVKVKYNEARYGRSGDDPTDDNGDDPNVCSSNVSRSCTPVLFSDDAESASPWTLHGFSTVGTSATNDFDNYYIAGHRTYVSYDRYLKTGPYNFGFLNTKPDWVEHYSYQQGLLISYWDRSQVDNDTNWHPGQGRNLYIDAHPRPFYRLDGLPFSARIQIYDAPFGLRKADSFTLHINGQPSYVRGQSAQPLFDDTQKYFYEELPNQGVKLPAVGVKIRVLSENGTSAKIRIS